MKWQQFAFRYPSSSFIQIHLDGKLMTLDAVRARLADYVMRRPADSILSSHLDAVLHDTNASKGNALRDGEVHFDNFRPVAFPVEPTWSENPLHDRSWQWSLHCLTVLRHLLAAHWKTNDQWYLNRAEELVADWMCDNYTPHPPCEFSWSDHSTALRLENVLLLLEYYRRISHAPTHLSALLACISTHASVLSEDEFYNAHTNHGLDQACSLYLAGAAFPELAGAEQWRNIARARIKDEVNVAFTSEGVHVENSPSYHFMMLKRLLQIDAMLRHYDGEGLGDQFLDLISKAFRFAAQITKPNGMLPDLGDTSSFRVKDEPRLGIATGLEGYEEFRYSVSQGRDGTRPSQLCCGFSQSGYAVFRDTWDRERFSDAFHLVFKAGFLSTYHKHDDDLSFVLCNRGEEWIIDAGLYRHHESDPLRQYVRSARAHNVVVVDDIAARRDRQHVGDSHIDAFEVNGQGATVRGVHRLYPSMTVSRELTYRWPSCIRIRDVVDVGDEKEHQFCALFHIPADKLVTVAPNGVDVRSRASGLSMFIRNVRGNCSRVAVVKGQHVPHLQGWMSSRYGEMDEAICVSVEGVGRRWDSELELYFGEASSEGRAEGSERNGNLFGSSQII